EGTSCVAFNRWGTLLAAGTSSGNVNIWDFETRGIARRLEQDVATGVVNSVSWTHNGRKLLGSLSIGVIVQWDVKSGTIDHVVSFPFPVLNADQHPFDMSLCAICFNGSPPVLARLNGTEAALTTINASAPSSKSVPKCVRFSENGDALLIGISNDSYAEICIG
ncbi:hypothetical protein BVRB_024730, partial [Beta vulgaris subsp. vulgaris]